MEPLRVLRLCSVYAPPSTALGGRATRFDPVGGMQDHTGALTGRLDARGVAQVVVTTRPPTAPWRERVGARALVIRVGVPLRRARQAWSLFAVVLAPPLGRRADVVHAHLGEDLALLPLAVLAARAGRAPLVLTVHVSLAHTLRARTPRTALLRVLGAPIERWGERRAARVVVLTRRLGEAVARDIGPERVRVVRRPVDRAAFAAPGPDPLPELGDGPRVVFLGRLVRAKGVEVLVDAAARLTTDAHVVLAGDGPLRRRVEEQIRAAGLEDRVRVTGFVDRAAVPALLATADVLVLPSLYEELGTVLLEAMQLGVPCVASRVGGMPEVLEHGGLGLLVPPSDPAALARAIDRILGDPALAARFRAAGLRRAPAHDWAPMVDETLRMYQELGGARAARRGCARRGVLDGLWRA